jgi:hypothetical protein
MKEFDPKNLTFRMLSLLDIKEFKDAAKESVETNLEYLSFGALFKDIRPIEYLYFYTEMLKTPSADHFGVFDGGTLLGHVSYQLGFSDLGTELMGWTRKDYQNHGLGEIGLIAASKRAFDTKGFNFVQLVIDEKNLPSRKVAEKVGFFPALKIPYHSSSSDSMVIYLKLSPRTLRLAGQFRRRPLDVMACPATAIGLTQYLNSDPVLEFYEWPFPPFVEGARPTNPYAFEDYVERVNFNPRGLVEGL